LENTIRNFKRLRDADIPVLTVDGSHDLAPNSITGTILLPLDSAGLIYHLPRHEGACWRKKDTCYVYGIPNFRSRRKTEEALPEFMQLNPPEPDPDIANIFVLHGAIDLPSVKPPYMEAEIPPELIPDGFDYYAAGHVHQRYQGKFKSGLLAYSGCTETVSYDEVKYTKGFFHVQVSEQGEFQSEVIELSSPRRFIVTERDFTGQNVHVITNQAIQMVKDNDIEDAVVIPVLRGILPAEASRTEIDVAHIRSAAEKALLVHPLILLKESAISDDVARSIFESEFKDLKTKAFEYFVQIFSERYSREEAERVAHGAIGLIEPLTHRNDEKVRQVLEELLR